MKVKRDSAPSPWLQVAGLALPALAALLLLALLSYDWRDLPLLHSPPNRPPLNFIGPAGAWAAFSLFMSLGLGAYLFAAMLFIQGVLLIFERSRSRARSKGWWMLLLLASLLVLMELRPGLWAGRIERHNLATPGGLLGHLLAGQLLVRLLGGVGAALVAWTALAIALVAVFETDWGALSRGGLRGAGWLRGKIEEALARRRDRAGELEKETRLLERRKRHLEKSLREQEPAAPPAEPAPEPAKKAPQPPPEQKKKSEPARRPPAQEPRREEPPPANADFTCPPISLLDPLPPAGERTLPSDFKADASILRDTLADFGMEAEITDVARGPVVTRYEILPAPGIRVERIVGLSNNIALAMKAESVRVQAPIPGKGVVGIEVPNSSTTLVCLREILESDAWTQSKAGLPLALGKDVSGREIVADLAQMPHLLIAGATGSGKTVCMNSLLAGLLMSRTPADMRLMLIDPKIVEFASYNHLPHLVVPVITDPKKVNLGLRWAIREMEKRYKLFARVGVRNIHSFNQRPILRQEELFGDAAQTEADASRPPDRLPYIVIVVDELADLMMVAQAEIENSIARLAQLSRAVGIHMIIATQRPSVNVITGTIKANFPARIAFQVAQKVDSRTILDANGADKLLGRGDMLFLPPGSGKLVRAQGTMSSDAEIHRIVEFLREAGEPSYELSIKEKIEDASTELPEQEEDTELLDTAIEIIRQTRRASTSSLQRRLRIGYTRAARLMDILEERGIVGPPRGSDPREILIDLDGEIVLNHTDGENVQTGE